MNQKSTTTFPPSHNRIHAVDLTKNFDTKAFAPADSVVDAYSCGHFEI
jgi:hypothetical protein